MFISMDFDYILLCMGVVLIIVEGLRYKFGFEILVIFSLYMYLYFNCWIECQFYRKVSLDKMYSFKFK